ncbi:DUF1479-domain-containing protein [Annulohypoxylon maeteangense]|uniref:DUF1479-domain-containing protein n=1 Tax=Annulohypoxylon maeteangense TaxID=1927788 RepID=UPI0020084414|nr:DUF1479-domain-containing protein [Annulohypoxylon maeteangense]KAI0881230.1 DUF1479-domain-containing protein [Annulohypoxylon maeteangense]
MLDKSLLPNNITLKLFKQALGRYGPLIESISSTKAPKFGPNTLLELDHFRYHDAINLFFSERTRPPMTLDHVRTLVDWKLHHGQFRPNLMKLVSSNSETVVQSTIQDAIEKYRENSSETKALKALAILNKLTGIGPATASLILSVYDPDDVIFFSDEAFYWLCTDGQTSPIKYTSKEYKKLSAAVHSLNERLGTSAVDVERVAYVLMKDSLPETISTDGETNPTSPIAPTSDAQPAQADSSTKKAKRKKSDTGNIMAVDFLSLQDPDPIPLPERFAKIKRKLIAGNEKAVADSFYRLLSQLRKEADRIAAAGSDIIPTIDYIDIHSPTKVAVFRDALKKRGVAVIRRVVPPNVAMLWKEETLEYLLHNPPAKGFPANDPQLYELFWSPGQVRARADSRLLEVQRFIMNIWHSNNEDALVSSNHPVAYADRIRIRKPGDTSLASGPHIDNGSVERWETDGYGRAGTYAKIFQGRWEDYDPWDSSTRLAVTSDLYNGVSSCSMFRMFQGWLSLSPIAPGSGSLQACPMLHLTTAYLLLRPFFSPRFPSGPNFLHDNNWNLNVAQTSIIQGAVPGCGIQELSRALHPHLRLHKTMVPIPRVEPGDYVLWHPDAVHAVDAVHTGLRDAGVLYVPACPLTQTNALYLARQRKAFLLGLPAPDFAASGGFLRGGLGGEREFMGRPGVQDVNDAGGEEGLRSMGLLPWDERRGIAGRVERELLRLANGILFPDRFDLGVGRKGRRG